MLILSRRPNESLINETADGPIENIITEITPGQAHLGIQAPKSCRILRKELVQTMQHNRQAAAKISSADLRRAISEFNTQG